MKKNIKYYKSDSCPVCVEQGKEMKKLKKVCKSCVVEIIDVDKHPEKAKHINTLPTIETEDKRFIGYTEKEKIISEK